MHFTTIRSRAVTFLAVSAATAFMLTSVASASPPIGKVFGCYVYTGGPAGISLVDAVQLKSRTSYAVAPSYKNGHLAGKAGTGTYKLQGNKLSFKTGAWKHMFGVYSRKYKDSTGNVHASQIDLQNSKHEGTGIACYQVS